VLNELATLLSTSIVKESQGVSMEEEELYNLDIEEAGYQSTFARLHSIARQQHDPVASVDDPKQFLRDKLSGFLAQHGGVVRS
jgi:hypothetical protein